MALTDDLIGGGDPAAGDAPDAPNTPGAGSGDGNDGGDGVPADLESAIADIDSQFVGDGEGGDSDSGEGSDGDARGGNGNDDPLDRFIKRNYAGDKDAFVAGLHESRAEARRLAVEVEQLKAQVSGKAATPQVDLDAELKTAAESDTRAKSLNREIEELATENQNASARMQRIANDAAALGNEVTELEAQLLATDDPVEGRKLERKISSKREAIRDISTEFQALENRVASNRRLKASTERSLDDRKETLRKKIEEDLENRAYQRTAGQRTITDFNDAFVETAGGYIFKDDEQRKETYELVRARLREYLDSRGDAPGLERHELQSATRKLFTRIASTFGLRKKGGGIGVGNLPGNRTPQKPSTRRPLAPSRSMVRPTTRGAQDDRDRDRDNGDGGGGDRDRNRAPRTLDELTPDQIRARAEQVAKHVATRPVQGRRGSV